MAPEPSSTDGQLRFEHQGREILVWKRRVHQWRTDLMIRVDARDLYLARYEGAMTRGDVKQLVREWFQKKPPILKGL